MIADHREIAFEDAIEADLVEQRGWIRGSPADFDAATALDRTQLFAFLEATQGQLLADLRRHHGAKLEDEIVGTLVKELAAKGLLHIVRHGCKFYGKNIRLAYFRPAHGLNPEVLELYDRNRLAVTRQVKFNPDTEQSIDMMLGLNGLPIATVELKNPLTGQTVEHAKQQYKEDRDPQQPLLQFKKRALVHFAVDPDEVYMTTRLAGEGTFFLPFNRGNGGGRGNPEHASGYRTGYLWQEVWERHSFLDIVARFVHLVQEEKRRPDGRVETVEKMIFPRYHQLDVVRKLEAAARAEGPGKSYLVQHSAGSGKSNSIAWTAHRLSNLHDDRDEKVFGSVVVITDRRVLDKQLQNTIYQFEHKQGVVARIDRDSNQLAAELAKGTPIIITTLQKFPFVARRIAELPERNYAVIVDEAHSSQTGESAQQMKAVLGDKARAATAGRDDTEQEPEEPDYEDVMAGVMASRGKQDNLSFFAFTATPKAKTLEVFGRPDESGLPHPFHLYSMRQAIEEGFILDVLRNYTTYQAYYRLQKEVEDDPNLPKSKAKKALARFMSLHPHEVSQKTEVIIEHFRQKVRHRIGGKAKAMLVTRSRLHAVRYKLAFEAYLAEHGYADIGVLVAFSGTVSDPDRDQDFTEVGMNDGIPESELPTKFAGDDYQLLLVANKYQTGFDQPLLHTMYVDKRLDGVQAVQTLSRLNRTCPQKEETFVLDFVNDADGIQKAFQPYYEQTAISETTDVQQLENLKHELDEAQVYHAHEVEALCKAFFNPKRRAESHADLYRHLDPARDRFVALEEEPQEEFRSRLHAFTRLYAFLSQILPYQDPELERLYTFARFLARRLPTKKSDPLNLDDDVTLAYYRLQKIQEGTLVMESDSEAPLKSATAVGTGQAKDDEAPLSQIIDVLNEKLGTDFTESDRLFFGQIVEAGKDNPELMQRARANDLGNFETWSKTPIKHLLIDQLDRNEDTVARCLEDDAFATVAQFLARALWAAAREGDEVA